MNPPPMLMLAREIEALSNCIQAEALQSNCSRAFLETYSARLLKAAAKLYAATLPPPATPAAELQTDSLATAGRLYRTFQGDRNAT